MVSYKALNTEPEPFNIKLGCSNRTFMELKFLWVFGDE